MRNVVVFPAPFGPMYPNTSPRWTTRLRRSSATCVPYCLVSASVWRMGADRSMGISAILLCIENDWFGRCDDFGFNLHSKILELPRHGAACGCARLTNV